MRQGAREMLKRLVSSLRVSWRRHPDREEVHSIFILHEAWHVRLQAVALEEGK